MPPCTLTVRVTELGADTGLWCDRCALPSGVVRTVAVEINGRANQIIQAGACEDCGAHL